jgi:hypothetical protein
MDKAEVAKLATTLLSDIEGGSLPIEILVTKALALAKVTADDDAITWLTYELAGYDASTPLGETYSRLTGRWDGTSDKGYFGPISAIVTTVQTMSQTLEVHKAFRPTGDFAMVHQNEKVKKVHEWATAIAPLAAIVPKLKAQLHLFASRVLVEAQFSDTSRSIFELYQTAVDKELASKAARAFEKLPHVFERLRNGEPEAVSHALTSCRRIIDSFADAVFPARSDPVEVDGQQLDCSAAKTKNRIRAFMAGKIKSSSRRERLNKNLGALYDRVSAGVHADVTIDEAQALVLNTYLLLGEIVSVPAP